MNIVRKACEIPVRNRTEVLVVGAGPAGFGAAVSAARAGAKVTLVEQGGLLGGMWTLGLLSPFFDNQNKDGLNRELREALLFRGGLATEELDARVDQICATFFSRLPEIQRRLRQVLLCRFSRTRAKKRRERQKQSRQFFSQTPHPFIAKVAEGAR